MARPRRMSAGLLLYRRSRDDVEVLIAHMGGPFWLSKHEGAWSIPKGEFDADAETAQDAAVREFREELGLDPPSPPYADLGTFVYASGKRVTVFAVDGSGFDVGRAVYGEFELEWPPRSGRRQRFPEVDRAAWIPLVGASALLVRGQRPALAALAAHLDSPAAL